MGADMCSTLADDDKEGRGGEAAKNKTLRYWPM